MPAPASASRHPRLSLLPQEALPMGLGAGLLERPGGAGVVFVGGRAAYSWGADEPSLRRLAALHLVRTRAASSAEVCEAFAISRTTLHRWRRIQQEQGWEALGQGVRRGPKGPSKLTPSMVEQIKELDNGKRSLAEIGAIVGVSTFSVRRALGRVPGADRQSASEAEAWPASEPEAMEGEMEAEATLAPLASMEPELGSEVSFEELPSVPSPRPRSEERRQARTGLLVEAAPVFTEGRELPMLGLLLILPALAQTGLLEAAQQVYGRLRNGFYGLRSLVLMLCFLTLLREPRAEGATRIAPADLGRLLALDRAPEVKTIRRKTNELVARGVEPAARLLRLLADQHVQARPEAIGFLYLDGHVTVYTGKRRLAKAHVARLRIAAPAAQDLWVCDQQGDPVFVIEQAPGSSLVREIRALLPELKRLSGGRRLTICFDRGGWSPELFSDILRSELDFITYRKGRLDPEPGEAFRTVTATVEGRELSLELADRSVKITTERKTVLELRQLVRRVGEHQTVIVTSRQDLPAIVLAHRMFSRWRQENWFKYGRTHFALDALDSYQVIADDPQRLVPNPEKARLKRQLLGARTKLTKLMAANSMLGLEREERKRLEAALDAARPQLTDLEARLKTTPERVRLAEVAPEARRLAPSRRLLAQALRLSAFNAESTLARLLHPHYRRAEDEARSLLREAFKISGDLRVADGHLEVRLNPLSAPRRTAALAALCLTLTATATVYPGTNLVIRYAVKDAPTVA